MDAQGARVREPGGETWEEAKDALAQAVARNIANAQEQANLEPGEVLATQETFADVADRYLAYQQARLKSPKSYQREAEIMARMKTSFSGKLADIRPADVSNYVTMRLGTITRFHRKVAKSSVRKELIALKHLFRLAYDEWELLPETHPNLTRKFSAPQKWDVERTQHLTPEQFRRVLAAAPENMKPIFALLTATGMRRSELLLCKWKYVDAGRIVLPPEVCKNNDLKEIHLNNFAQTVLASIPPGGPDDLLFPGVTPEAVSMAFHRVCQILSISDIRLHDCRHTFATWLRQRGVELDVIASQLGHRDLRMTKRYARIASSQVRQAVNGLDSVLLPAPEAQSENVSHRFVTEQPALPDGKPVTQ
jgi:integrase